MKEKNQPDKEKDTKVEKLRYLLGQGTVEMHSLVSEAPSLVSRKPQKPLENTSSQSCHRLRATGVAGKAAREERPEAAKVSPSARASCRTPGRSSPARRQCPSF